MSCFNSCLIACALLGSKLLIMGSSGYSKNRQLLVESLDESQREIYHGIVKQRGELFMQGLLFGCTVGALSLYPTFTYILWAIPLSKGDLPIVSTELVSRLKMIINIELLGFASIPFIATLMARGVGLS